MSDMRKPLPNGFCLNCGGRNYTICSELDRGASSIVYNAEYFDEENQQHYVLIKELYPHYQKISRQTDQSLGISDKETFAKDENYLITAYKRNTDLKKTMGMTNSTVNPIGIFKANNTRYIITDCIEGKNYCEECDSNIHTVFVRMLALAKILREYHKKGFLHLDIKPSNILVIPETAEHIYLFDFDSLQLKSDIRSGNVKRLSFSNGFSAPELIHGKYGELCDATDFYSIGAIVYVKLFGTMPSFTDFSISYQPDFSSEKFKDQDPDLLKKLTRFFRKTLTPSVLSRFGSDDELITALDELADLSDLERPYLIDSFTYISGYFVGREKELADLDEKIKSNHTVFVSGIGGIGKTELVRYYVHTHRKEYRRVVFVSYTENIISTFCSKDIFIKNFSRGTDEEEQEFYNRKLSVFNEIADENDLFILDNFDTDNCDEILELLKCRCKFIVTTRSDFRDYNVCQTDISSIDNMETLLKLFRIYNPLSYPDDEEKYITDLIELVERHTMTVELIAKYLRITQEAPSKMFADITQKEGIANTDRTAIKQRKDNRMCSSDIVTHLLSIFDLSGFTESQCEVIKSLSLLGYINIRREKFFELCPVPSCIEDIEHLVKSGWIQSEDSSGKIHLHQIILDLVYNELKPTTESCPHITEFMDAYIQSDCENMLAWKIRYDLLKNFINRVTGNDIACAKLFVDYSYFCGAEDHILEKAYTICISLIGQESEELLYRIYLMQIEILIDDSNWFLYEEIDENNQTQRIIDLCDKAFSAAEHIYDEPEHLAETCIKISDIVSDAAEKAYIADDIKLKLLDTAEKFTMRAEQYISDDIPCEQKVELYRSIQNFYVDIGYMNIFRSEHYRDSKKALYYQRIIDDLSEDISDDDPTVICSKDIFSASYDEAAFTEMNNGEYQTAIELYEMAIQDPYCFSESFERLADCYIALGDHETAINTLKEGLDRFDEQSSRVAICTKLINVLFDKGNYEECRYYSQSLISEGTDPSEGKIIGYYFLYKLEDDICKQKTLWNKCCSLFKQIDKDSLSISIQDFVVEYAEKIDNLHEKIELLLDIAQRIHSYDDNGRIYQIICKMCDGVNELAQYHITALLGYAQLLDRLCNGEEIMSICQKAESVYLSSDIGDDMFKNDMYYRIGKLLENTLLYDNADEEFFRKCDMYMLAESRSAGVDDKKQFEIWFDTLQKYTKLEQYAMGEKCCDKIISIIQKDINQSEFFFYSNISWNIQQIIECLGHTHSYDKIRKILHDIYPHILYYYENLYTDETTEKTEQCAESINMLASSAGYAGEKKSSIILNMAYIVIITGGYADNETIQKSIFNDSDSINILVKKVISALETQLSPQQIDKIIEVKESIQENAEFADPDVLQALEHFSLVYEKSDIEFRR